MNMEQDFKVVYCVYIVTDEEKKRLEVGITAAMQERLKKLEEENITDACKYLVYYEKYDIDRDSVKREQKLSAYSQRKLRKLVETLNPQLEFLDRFSVQ